MALKTSRTHGGTDFQRRLEGNDLDVEPLGLEEPFVGRGLQNDRVRSRERPDAKGFGGSGPCGTQGEKRGADRRGRLPGHGFSSLMKGPRTNGPGDPVV